jgi:hypothetical protein
MSPVRWLLVAALAVGTAGCCCGTCKTDNSAETAKCSACEAAPNGVCKACAK